MRLENFEDVTDILNDCDDVTNRLENCGDVTDRLNDCDDVTDSLNDSDDVTDRLNDCDDVTDRLNDCDDVTDRLNDYEDVPSSLDYFDIIKIEIEEITFSVDPIIKEDTEEGKGLVDVKSGNIYFDHGQIYIYIYLSLEYLKGFFYNKVIKEFFKPQKNILFLMRKMFKSCCPIFLFAFKYI